MADEELMAVPENESRQINAILDSVLNNEMKISYGNYLELIKQYRPDKLFELENDFLCSLRSAVIYASTYKDEAS